MPGLFMKLEPNERFFVNGVLIANGDRRSTLNVIENTSVVMRERALVTPEIAKTDLGRLLLLAQNALLGLIDKDHAMRRLQNAQWQFPATGVTKLWPTSRTPLWLKRKVIFEALISRWSGHFGLKRYPQGLRMALAMGLN